MFAGSLKFDTSLDSAGFQKGVNKITNSAKTGGSTVKSIVAGLGITKVIEKGLQTITANIDGAVKRIDTLNNFPKVMQLFGVSVDEASASIKRIEKSVQGLPTSLDQAAAGVQDLFTVTKDLKKSEELFRAVNDSAMVFASGSTEAVNHFIYGYKQALSSGKVSAQDFNQMNEAIPGLMSKVAEKMGITYSQLKEGLSDQSITIDEFNNALKDLDENGVGSMEALQTSAKTATGGIQTSFTNMKTAMTRGVADIITAVDDLLKENGLGGIQGVLDTIGTTAENVFSKLGEIIRQIPLSEMIDLFKKLAPVILAVVAAQKTYNTILGLFKIAGIIANVGKLIGLFVSLVPAIRSVKDAMTLLNLVFAVNPVALIITAIVGLVAAFVILWNKCEGFRNFWIGLWEGIKSVFSTVITAIINFFTTTIPNAINTVITVIKNLPYYIGYVIGLIIGKIIQFGINLWTFVTQDIPQIITNIINWFKELPGKIWTTFLDILSKLITWGINMRNKSIEAMKKVVKGIVNTIKNLPSKMFKIGKDIVHGIWNGLKNAEKWLIKKVKEFAKGVVNGIKDALGIHSPSKVMRDEVGKWIPRGVAVGIEANTDSAIKALKNMSDEITTTMQKSVDLSTGSVNADALINANYGINNTIVVNANLNADVDMDGQKVGRIVTPSVMKTIKVGGGSL